MKNDQGPESPAGATDLDPRLADVLESVSDGFYALDRAWRYVAFNPAAEAYFGISRELVMGRNIWEVFPQGRGTPFEAACRHAMDEGRVSTFETLSALRPGHIVELRIAPLREVGVAVILNDVTERKAAEQRMQTMVQELNHRVKNSMAAVQGLARQTFAASRSLEEARESFTSRLMALAAAHDMVTEQNWEGAALDELVDRAVAERLQDRGRFSREGPSVRIEPRMALSLALALHELATNAYKYGALSNDEGQVRVSWTVAGVAGDLRLSLVWRESGGPPVAPPRRRGFGSRLLERALAADLAGRVDLRYEPAGLVCEIEAPLPQP